MNTQFLRPDDSEPIKVGEVVHFGELANQRPFSAAELLDKVEEADITLAGENHYAIRHMDLMIENIQELRARGVRTIFMEGIPRDIILTPDTDEADVIAVIETSLASNDVDTDGRNSKLVKAALAAGMDIRGIDLTRAEFDEVRQEALVEIQEVSERVIGNIMDMNLVMDHIMMLMKAGKMSSFEFTEELRDSLGLKMSYAEFMALMEAHDNDFTQALGSVLQQQQELATLPAKIMNETALRKRNVVMNKAIDVGMEDFTEGEKAIALVGSYHLLGSDSLRVHLRNKRKVYSVIFAGIERELDMFTVSDPTVDTMGDISDDITGVYLPEPSRGV